MREARALQVVGWFLRWLLFVDGSAARSDRIAGQADPPSAARSIAQPLCKSRAPRELLNLADSMREVRGPNLDLHPSLLGIRNPARTGLCNLWI